ncbi:MAG: hypothetical protein H7Y11_15535, partial [Armatimonadetes bacterium]|nr:hypothetical protein [Anaerolineae bacterium]
ANRMFKDANSSYVAPPLAEQGLVIFGITLAEIAFWTVWWSLAQSSGYVLAVLFLTVCLWGLHSFELAILRKRPITFYLKDPQTLLFTVVEGVGGTLWLVAIDAGNPLLGALILFSALSLEHIIQGSALKPELGQPSMA